MVRPLKCALLCATALLIATASAHAAPTWLPSAPLSPDGSEAANSTPDIASDGVGDVIAVWDRDVGAGQAIIEAGIRPAGGGFSVTQISGDGSAHDAQIAMNESGEAVAVWWESHGSDNYVRAAIRPPGGVFGSPVTISGPGGQDPRIAINASGEAVAAWDRFTGNDIIEAAIRPAGGSFGSAAQLSLDGDNASSPTVAMNDSGVSAVAWGFHDSNTGRDLIQGNIRAAGGSFPASPAPDTISDTSADGFDPEVGVDAAGNTTAVYRQANASPPNAIEAKVRPANGPWPSESDLLQEGDAGDISLSVRPDGAAVVAWAFIYDDNTSNYAVKAAVRASGESFGSAKTLGPLSGDSAGSDAAMNDNGDAVVIWRENTPDHLIHSNVRPAGGSFGGPQTLSASDSPGVNYPAASIDPFGNAAAVWGEKQAADSSSRARAAGFDASPPTLDMVSIPAIGSPGSALLFSATPHDIWSPVTTGWSFSDGGTASGNPVSHIFAAPGSYAATVTATDAVGNAASLMRNVSITAASVILQTPVVTPDRTAPGISGLALSPSRFRSKSTIKYTLSEAATVTFTIQRAAPGRKVGRRCVAPTKRNRSRKRCTRFVAVKGSLTQNGNVGANTLAFNRRIGGRKLAPGTYRLTAEAKDPAGNKSALTRVNFTIIK
jgi:hypothetical protein